MGTTVFMDTALSGVKAAVDLSSCNIEGATRSPRTGQVELDFGGASIPRGLTVRFEPTDSQVTSVLRAWDTTGNLAFETLAEAIDQDRFGEGEVLFGRLDLPPVCVEKR